MRTHRACVMWCVMCLVTTMAVPVNRAAAIETQLLPLDSLRALEESAPNPEEVSDGVVLLDERIYSYTDSLTYTYTIHRVVKIARPSGRDAYGTGAVAYDGHRERLASCTARTIKPDGQVHEVAQDQFVNQDSDAIEFSDRQTIAWPFPHVDSGDVIEFLALITGTSRRKGELYVTVTCNESDPLGIQRIALTCPAAWPIRESLSSRVKRTQTDAGGETTRIWVVEDVVPIESESLSPSLREQADWITFGYENCWADEAKWYDSVLAQRIEMTNRIKELSRELSAKAKSREGKIAALFRFVSREIRYVAITLGEGEMEPHSAGAILDAKYGDCKDKTVLLISLLRAAGIPAGAAGISSVDTAWFEPEIANLGQFDHMIVFIPGDPLILLDPTCEVCRWNELPFHYKNQPLLLLDGSVAEPLVRTPGSDTRENGWQREIRVVADTAGGATIDVILRGHGGIAENYVYDLPDLDSSSARGLVEEMTVQGLWHKLDKHEFEVLSNPDSGFVITLKSRFRNDSLFAENAQNMLLPVFINPITWAVTLPDTVGRTRDVRYRIPKTITTRMKVVHGDAWEQQKVRISWEVDTTWYRCTSAVTEWEDSSEVLTTFEFPACRVPLAEYPAFLRSFDMLRNRLWCQSPNYRRKPDEALIARLEKELKRTPNSVPILAALAQTYLGDDFGGSGCAGRERRAKAQEYLEKARAEDPRNEAPVIYLATLMILSERFADADSLLKAHAEANGRSVLTDALLASTSQQLAHYDELLEYIKRTSSTPSAEGRSGLAEAYAMAGDRDNAESQIALMEVFGDDPQAIRLVRMRTAIHLRDWQRADSLVSEFKDMEEEMRLATLASIADLAGRPHDMARYIAQALAQNPDNPLLANNYAWALALCDSLLDVALASAEHASRIEGPCDWSSRNTRAYVLLKMGKIDEARREFKECLTPQDAKSRTINYYCLGECERLSGNPAAARDYYKEAIRYGGDRTFEAMSKSALAEIGE